MMSFEGQQEIPKDEGDGADDDEWVSVCSFEKRDVVMPAGKDMKDKELKLKSVRTFVSCDGNLST